MCNKTAVKRFTKASTVRQNTLVRRRRDRLPDSYLAMVSLSLYVFGPLPSSQGCDSLNNLESLRKANVENRERHHSLTFTVHGGLRAEIITKGLRAEMVTKED